jgi:hypothetical protein|tara:strand:- start:511 stop:813 length:303 start_codon:yes stop_codon:yes gene_type:complete
MPYTETALQNLEFYQNMIREDEAKYLKLIQENIESGNTDDGILRDNNGNIILFEKIISGQGTDGTSHTSNHTLTWELGYFMYEDDEEEINKIIDREFTEL